MYLVVRLELFESCIIPKSNFQIIIYGIRKMTRISIKNTILRIVAQVVVFDRGNGLVPYTMITNCFAPPCGHAHTYRPTKICRYACMHTRTHTCAGADTHPDPELHDMFHLNYHEQKPNIPQRLLLSVLLHFPIPPPPPHTLSIS